MKHHLTGTQASSYFQSMKERGVPDRIFLIGMMGAGKSTAGFLLATRLGRHFVDLDEVIEQSAGRTITEIFSDSGEDVFRRLEHEALRSTANLHHTVIATGGGAPCFRNGMEFMKRTGCAVYLRASIKTLVERTSGAVHKRPLLDDTPEKRLKTLLGDRGPVYTSADVIIDVDDKSAEVVVNEICAYFRTI